MNPMLHIRRDLFGVTQAEMGRIAGTTQVTVWRWEAGRSEPSRDHLARIRAAAAQRGLPWNDAWFFDSSESSQPSDLGVSDGPLSPAGDGAASAEAAGDISFRGEP